LAHSAATITIKFASNLNETPNNESFGLSDLKIYYCNKNHGNCFTDPITPPIIPTTNPIVSFT